MPKKISILFQQMWKIYLLGCIGYFLPVSSEAQQVRQQLNINVYRATSNVFADGVVALFGKNYKAIVDDTEDLNKFTNLNETFGLRRDNTELALEKRPIVAAKDTLYFNMRNFNKIDYRLVIDGSNFSNIMARFEDKYKGIKTTINLNDTTTYNFTVNDDTASISNDRFKITFASVTPPPIVIDSSALHLIVKINPNPVRNQLQVSFRNALVEEKAIHIINSLGQVVKTVNSGKVSTVNITMSVSDLAVGVYNIQLLSGGKVISTEQVVKEQY